MAGEIKALQFSEGTSVSAPTQNAIDVASFAKYASDAAYVTDNGAATGGDAYFNTSTKEIRWHDDTTWSDLSGAAGGGGAAGINTVETIVENAKLDRSYIPLSVQDSIEESFIEDDTDRLTLTNTDVNVEANTLYLTSTNTSGSCVNEIYLKSTKSNQTIEYSVRFDTETYFDCNAGTLATESKLASVGSDRDTEIYNGTTSYGWFVRMKRSSTSLPWKQADTGQRVSITAASYAADVITVTHSTLTGTIPSPTTTDKYIFILENAQPLKKSIASESAVTLTPDKIKVLDTNSMQYPSYIHSHWKMNGSVGEPNSKQTSGYDLVQQGTVGSSTGKLLRSRGTYSSGNYLYWSSGGSSSTAYDQSGGFGVEAWIKNSSSGATFPIITKWSGNYYGFRFELNSSGQIVFVYGTSGGAGASAVRSNGTVNDGNWHHVWVGKIGTSGATNSRIYIDGTQATYAAQDSTAASVGSTANLQIGATTSSSEYFTSGYIDEVAFWNSMPATWTDAETIITARYFSGKARTYGNNYGYMLIGSLAGQSASASDKFEFTTSIRREVTTVSPTVTSISVKF